MAVTDDERRRVAERLRGLHDYETANVIVRTCLGLRPGMLMDKGTRRRMGDFIADLIDPDCDEGRYEGVHTARPVDREALLALAEELEEDACWEVQTPGDTSGAWRLKDACDRIREALVVSDDA